MSSSSSRSPTPKARLVCFSHSHDVSLFTELLRVKYLGLQYNTAVHQPRRDSIYSPSQPPHRDSHQNNRMRTTPTTNRKKMQTNTLLPPFIQRTAPAPAPATSTSGTPSLPRPLTRGPLSTIYDIPPSPRGMLLAEETRGEEDDDMPPTPPRRLLDAFLSSKRVEGASVNSPVSGNGNGIGNGSGNTSRSESVGPSSASRSTSVPDSPLGSPLRRRQQMTLDDEAPGRSSFSFAFGDRLGGDTDGLLNSL